MAAIAPHQTGIDPRIMRHDSARSILLEARCKPARDGRGWNVRFVPKATNALQNQIRCVDQTTALALAFLRQPSNPIAPTPDAKSGSVAGSGVGDKGESPTPSLMSSW
jgi:hypothetical protein